jgi:hypothetical protein
MGSIFIRNHAGEGKYYTEESLYNQIMDDAIRSRYDWCAPVTEIARVVPAFSKEHKDDIYRAVLDCYYHIQAEHKLSSDAQEAIWEIFLDLDNESEENRKIKEFYASRHVTNAVVCSCAIFHMHYGDAWRQFLDKFRSSKGQEWRKCHSPDDLQNWADALVCDLEVRLAVAEAKGIFEKDDAEYLNHMISRLKEANFDPNRVD